MSKLSSAFVAFCVVFLCVEAQESHYECFDQPGATINNSSCLANGNHHYPYLAQVITSFLDELDLPGSKVPHVVEKKFVRTGYLIHPQYILVPAFFGPLTLTDNSVNFYVKLGSDAGLVFNVSKTNFIPYPNSLESAGHVNRNNIGLLKLDHPVQFSEKVQPICINTQVDYPKDSLVYLVYDVNVNEEYSNPHEVDFKALTNENCGPYLDGYGYNASIISESVNLCVQDQPHPDRACLGDKSAGVLIPSGHCVYNLVGIPNLDICNSEGNVKVYTNVAPFVDFIRNTVNADR